MQAVSRSQVVTTSEPGQEPLPPRIQEALGQLVGAAKEGLLALSVSVGRGVLEEVMGEEVEEVCGAKGKRDGADDRRCRAEGAHVRRGAGDHDQTA